MQTSELKYIVSDQNKAKIRKQYIKRDLFDTLVKSFDNELIIIVTGVRRSGKSTIIQMLSENHPGYFLSFDDDRLINFKVEDFQSLYEIFIELFGQRRIFYFDEIQNIKGWERFIRRLHDEGMKIFLTGSNATLLSKELGTHLTGRNIRYELYPFSFREFLRYKGQPGEIVYDTRSVAGMRSYFSEYLTRGGLPEFLLTDDLNYLKSFYNDLLYRDIIVRYQLPNEKIVKEFANLAIQSTTKGVSYNSLKSALNLGSATTITEYFHYFRECYMLFLVNCHKDSLKKQAQNPKKLYCIDNSLLSYISFRISEDFGKLLENSVFLHLARNGAEVFYNHEKRECDFLVKEGNEITEAIQVCYELNNTNKEREFEGLREAMNKYKLIKGKIITFGQESTESDIHVIPAWKWMLGNEG